MQHASLVPRPHPFTRRVHVYVNIASIVPDQQIHNNESQEAFEDCGYVSKISDNSVVIGALAIRTH